MMKLNRSTPSYLRPLMVAQACALFAVSSAWAQTAAQPSATTPPPARPMTPEIVPAKPVASEDVVKLSPFEVKTSAHDIGYYAENTLAGSRLNTNVGDLAASITIVTKQQMVDTASVNINDVFAYEANTEGTRNYYSPLNLNRSAVKDTMNSYSADDGTSFTSANSNRVRGISNVSTGQDNYPTINRLPFDAYNTNSIEINRGPNSLLFGMGQPAGIVNQSTTSAIIGKRQTEVSAAFSSFGGFRSSINHNQPINDNLAIDFALLYDSVGFERKPSYDITRRQFGTLTWQPFSKTKIKASVEAYVNDNRRPNTLTPRDWISNWVTAGRPAYDPITRMVTFQDTGRVLGPYTLTTTTTIAGYGYVPGTMGNDGALTLTNSSQFVPQLSWTDYTRTAQYIDSGTMSWWQRQANATTTTPWFAPTQAQRLASAGAAQQLLFERRTTQSNTDLAPTQYASWLFPGVTNKALYDWDKVNIVSVNFGRSKARAYNFEIEQELRPNLHLSAGWFRQEYTSDDNYTMGNQNGPQIFIDTNTKLPDGTPNPHFGAPFVTDDASQDTFKKPEWMDNLKVLLAYEVDFTKDSGWTRWLGHHNFLGLWTRLEDLNDQFRYRNTIMGGDPRYMPNMTVAGWSWQNNGATIRHQYYVGDTTGNVTRSPGYWGNPSYGGPTSGNITTYDWATGQYVPVPVNLGMNLWTSSTSRAERWVTSRTFAMQNYFLQDRIVATLGWRKDAYRARNTDMSGLANTDLFDNNGFFRTNLLNRMTSWERLTGSTKTQGIVVKPLSWFSVFYNKSNNFNPPPSRQTDFFNNSLPKPVGDGKDYGVAFSFFDNKLTARLNWFNTTSENERNAAAASTIAGRVQRMDTSNFRSWAEYVIRIRNGQDIHDTNFTNATVNPLTQAMQDQIAALMQLPYSWPSGYNIGATQTNQSKGLEYQLIYNPLRNWNMKLTVGKATAIYSDVAPEAAAWIANRMPIWQAAAAPDMPALAQLNSGRNVSLRNFYTGYGFNADALDTNTNGATNPGGFWDSIVQPDYNTVKALSGTETADQRKWRVNILSTYQFLSGPVKGFGFGGAVRWESKLGIGYWGDTVNGLNSIHQIASPDITRPIYDKARANFDLWFTYSHKVFGDRSNMRLQLNIRDVTSSGGLMPIYVNLAGQPVAFRIRDPRTYTFSTTFDF
jgi:hypothetical protein